MPLNRDQRPAQGLTMFWAGTDVKCGKASIKDRGGRSFMAAPHLH